MDNINIIKEALTYVRSRWDTHDGQLLEIDKVAAALTALDRLTVKVSDEEIERIAMDTCARMASPQGDVAWEPEEVSQCISALRHARDRWLAPSPWIKTSERLPEMPDEMYGAMVSKKVLAHLGHDDYEIMQCQQEIGKEEVQWFNGVDVVDAPRSWTFIPNPTK